MISLSNKTCRKFTVKYIDNKGLTHNLELYAFSIEQARRDTIDLIPYVYKNPDAIKGITEHS
tara:strand:+ start:251 stop:436 length:186 start_codon:yes stop_codon:yes gene_type:complete